MHKTLVGYATTKGSFLAGGRAPVRPDPRDEITWWNTNYYSTNNDDDDDDDARLRAYLRFIRDNFELWYERDAETSAIVMWGKASDEVAILCALLHPEERAVTEWTIMVDEKQICPKEKVPARECEPDGR